MKAIARGEYRKLLGQAIRTRRHELALSQEKLAERAGLHRTYVADIERGSRNPGLDNVVAIAKALELSLSQLFSLVEADRPAE